MIYDITRSIGAKTSDILSKFITSIPSGRQLLKPFYRSFIIFSRENFRYLFSTGLSKSLSSNRWISLSIFSSFKFHISIAHHPEAVLVFRKQMQIIRQFIINFSINKLNERLGMPLISSFLFERAGLTSPAWHAWELHYNTSKGRTSKIVSAQNN